MTPHLQCHPEFTAVYGLNLWLRTKTFHTPNNSMREFVTQRGCWLVQNNHYDFQFFIKDLQNRFVLSSLTFRPRLKLYKTQQFVFLKLNASNVFQIDFEER